MFALDAIEPLLRGGTRSAVRGELGAQSTDFDDCTPTPDKNYLVPIE
jgi:hypothetical protein